MINSELILIVFVFSDSINAFVKMGCECLTEYIKTRIRSASQRGYRYPLSEGAPTGLRKLAMNSLRGWR